MGKQDEEMLSTQGGFAILTQLVKTSRVHGTMLVIIGANAVQVQADAVV